LELLSRAIERPRPQPSQAPCRPAALGGARRIDADSWLIAEVRSRSGSIVAARLWLSTLIGVSAVSLAPGALAQAVAPRAAVGSAEQIVALPAEEQPWCYSGEGIEALTPTVCHFSPAPPESAPDTLVIFLHGVTKLGTTWQWNGQRGVARAARANGFEVIMPRGRIGAGSKKFADYWNWPSSAEGQRTLEGEVIAEWLAAKAKLEERNGRPFQHVFVFGFSAGAYYAASLALRARTTVDGYAVFAGGSAPKGVERWAKGTHPKVPIYVGYGFRDKAHRDPQRLGRALRRMGWKHRVVGRRKVGHSMTDAQVREAIAFLAGKAGPAASKPATAKKKPAAKKPGKPRRKHPRPKSAPKPKRGRKGRG
jgi:predicted esterase